MLERGHIPGTRLVAIERRPVEVSIGRHLRLAVSAPAYVMIRLRLVNQEAVMIENYTVPADRFPDLDRHDLEGRSLDEIMEQEYHVLLSRARQSLEPVVSTEFEANLLGDPAGGTPDAGAASFLRRPGRACRIWERSLPRGPLPVHHGCGAAGALSPGQLVMTGQGWLRSERARQACTRRDADR